jgi:hypothetical protein
LLLNSNSPQFRFEPTDLKRAFFISFHGFIRQPFANIRAHFVGNFMG